MKPVLAHYRRLLPGPHAFALRWRVPRLPAGATMYLTFAWTSHYPPATVAGAVATLVPD